MSGTLYEDLSKVFFSWGHKELCSTTPQNSAPCSLEICVEVLRTHFFFPESPGRACGPEHGPSTHATSNVHAVHTSPIVLHRIKIPLLCSDLYANKQ